MIRNDHNIVSIHDAVTDLRTSRLDPQSALDYKSFKHFSLYNFSLWDLSSERAA